MEFKQYLLIGALATGLLTGCGSDSDSDVAEIGATYSGSESEAKITEISKASFQKSAVELVSGFSIAGLAEENLPIDMFLPMAADLSVGVQALSYQDEVEAIKELVENLGNSNSVLPVGITQEVVIDSTCEGIEGSLTISTTSSEPLDEAPVAMVVQDPAETFEMSQSFVFNNFCDEGTGSLVWNGTVRSDLTESNTAGSLSLHIQNFSMSPVGSNESITFSAKLEMSGSESRFDKSLDISLTSSGLSAAVSITEACSEELNGCTESTVFKGIDGKIHRIDNAEYDYNYGELEYIEGELYDSKYGYVYLVGNEVNLCEGDSGDLLLENTVINLYQASNVEIEEQMVSVSLRITAGECGVYNSEIITQQVPM